MRRGIPPELESAVLERAGKGVPTREIAAWLTAAHGVTVSHVTVAKLLARHRTERADVAKGVLREKLTQSLGSDLEELAALQADLKIRAAECRHETRDYLAVVDRIVKVIDLKMHYSGADQPDEGPREIVLEWPDPPDSARAAPDAGEGGEGSGEV